MYRQTESQLDYPAGSFIFTGPVVSLYRRPYSALTMSTHKAKLAVCPNCGTALRPADNFCPNCGQENHDLKMPIGHIAYEFVESITHFDTKLWNTLKAIFTRPGKMTTEFLEGKRARYVPPARLYVFVSVIFFFLAAKYANHQQEKELKTTTNAQTGETTLRLQVPLGDIIRNDSLLRAQNLRDVAEIELEETSDKRQMAGLVSRLRSASPQQLDSLLATKAISPTPENRQKLRQTIALLPDQPTAKVALRTGLMTITFDSDSARKAFQERMSVLTDRGVDSLIVSMNGTPNWWNRLLVRQGSKLLSFDDTARKTLVANTFKYLSFVMFLLMPVVALLLFMIYYRRERYYYEHLIFSVHIHTVLFILFSAAMGIGYFSTSLLVDWAFLVGLVYFLLSLKRVYGQSWLKTSLKFLILSFLYLIVTLVFVIGASVAGVLTL